MNKIRLWIALILAIFFILYATFKFQGWYKDFVFSRLTAAAQGIITLKESTLKTNDANCNHVTTYPSNKPTTPIVLASTSSKITAYCGCSPFAHNKNGEDREINFKLTKNKIYYYCDNYIYQTMEIPSALLSFRYPGAPSVSQKLIQKLESMGMFVKIKGYETPIKSDPANS